MKLYYFVDKEKVRQGPLPLEDLRSYEITPQTLVWSKGMKNWQKAKDIPDFQGFFDRTPADGASPAESAANDPQTESGQPLLHASLAAKYGVTIDRETSDFIRDNSASKLQIVKHIKDKYQIGLAEAKAITDEIFESGQIRTPAPDAAPAPAPDDTPSSSIDRSRPDPTPVQNSVQEDKASIGLLILCFFIPIVGVILYFVKKDKYPNSAKAYLFSAMISILIYIILN